MAPDGDDWRDRLARLEERVEGVRADVAASLQLQREQRDAQQQYVGLVSTMKNVQDRQVEDAASLRSLWDKVDPLVHSSPPIADRLRTVEDQQLVQRTQVKVMAVIATFVAPLLTALLVAELTDDDPVQVRPAVVESAPVTPAGPDVP